MCAGCEIRGAQSAKGEGTGSDVTHGDMVKGEVRVAVKGNVRISK